MIYAFEDFVLDARRRELHRAGELVPVEPQVFDLLLYLVRNRDRVVSKDDLIAEVWGGRIISEATLSSRINAARQALGDSGERQRLIRTVARRGFRFVGEVREHAGQGDARAVNPAPQPSVAVAAELTVPSGDFQAVLTLPDKPSIVVLPFTNLSGDPEQEYFADGMVEDITLALGRLPWLFVIGSTSAFTYKNQAVDARKVGAELGVRYILRGSVRRAGNQVRITAQLTDASHGGQIWADRFEGELDDIFAMQDRVAADVSTMIAPALRTAEIERTDREPTENLTAYDLFLRASRHYRESFEQNQESLRLLHRAIELDPSYGAAYGLAAFCHSWQKLFGWIEPTDPRIEEGVRLAHLAAERGKNDSEALWMAAQSLTFLAGELDQARAFVEKSISLNPNSPSAWTTSGIIHGLAGNSEISIEHAARARRHNPLDPLANFYSNTIAFTYFWGGRFEECVRVVDQVLSREPAFPPALRLKAAVCGMLGRVEEGREAIRRLLAVNPDASIASMQAFYAAPLRQHPRGLENFLKGMRASGLPEG